jgi:predicted acyl esterase
MNRFIQINKYKILFLLIFLAVIINYLFIIDLIVIIIIFKDYKYPQHSVITERKLNLTLSDGVKLSSDIHYPMNTEKSPTILIRIPFSKSFFNTIRSDIISRYWASYGYTVVIQGTRGRYNSEGDFIH